MPQDHDVDALWEKDLGPDDVLIAVLGVTGSGKSSFINDLVEDDVVVGHTLTSCTEEIHFHPYQHRDGKRVFLIDTPGFNDTNRADVAVLQELAYVLAQTYRQGVQLTGLVYLHRITDNRMSGSSRRNLDILKQLCGESFFPHVALTSTMWNQINGKDGRVSASSHLKELVARPDWWGDMKQAGSMIVRYHGDAGSAADIIDDLIDARDSSHSLQIQRELVDQNLPLEKTKAGEILLQDVMETIGSIQEELKDLEAYRKHAVNKQKTDVMRMLEEQTTELKERIEDSLKAQQALKVSFEQLSAAKSAEYQQLKEQQLQDQRDREAEIKKHEDEMLQNSKRLSEWQFECEKQLRYLDRMTSEQERKAQEQRIHQLEAQVAKYKQRSHSIKKKADAAAKKSKRRYLMPVLNVLADVGKFVLGVVTMNPVSLLSGVEGLSNQIAGMFGSGTTQSTGENSMTSSVTAD